MAMKICGWLQLWIRQAYFATIFGSCFKITIAARGEQTACYNALNRNHTKTMEIIPKVTICKCKVGL